MKINSPLDAIAERYSFEKIGKVAPRKSKDIRASAIGIGFETLDRKMFDPERVYPWLADSGVKWARVQTGWARCEKIKGEYDFSWLDDIVDNLLEIGIQPWFNVGFGNRLYSADAPHESAVGFVPLYYGDEAIKAWTKFISAIAGHFSDRVKHWEIWNEPNVNSFWAPQKPNPKDYVELVKISALEIRRKVKNSMIIGGVMACFNPVYFEGLMEAGLTDLIDIFTYHPYRSVPEHGYEVEVNTIRRILKEHNPNIKLWQGENGSPSVTGGECDEWLGIFNMNEINQSKWLARRIMTDLKLNLEFTEYFHAIDLVGEYYQSFSYSKKEILMGVLNGREYTPKSSYFTLQCLCSIFDQEAVLKDFIIQALPKGKSDILEAFKAPKIDLYAVNTVSFVKNEFPLYAYWFPEDPQIDTPSKAINILLWNDSKFVLKEPVLIDPLSQTVYKIRDFKLNKNGALILDSMPLLDYPLIITDINAIPHI